MPQPRATKTLTLLAGLALPAALLTLPDRSPAQEAAAKPDATPAPDEGKAKSPRIIKEWGDVTDPAGDCTFEADQGKLVITVPAECPKAHNLCAELSNMDAPRVLQTLDGDFDLQVKVDGTFEPGKEHGTGSRVPYQGAGLVVIADAANYIRMERATMLFGELRNYINFEIRVDGELQRFGSNEKFPLDPAKPVWLRLERRGETMRGGMSHDGREWSWGEAKELTSKSWAKESLQAGVHAVSSSSGKFAPVFAEFLCGAPGEAEKREAEAPAKETQP